MASAASYSNLVQELYVAYFGRPADYFGLQNFEAALAAASAPTDVAGLVAAYSTNAAVKSLVDSFGTSAESTALYGSGSTESFVTAIFENLFNRPPAVAGLSFWVNAINSGAVTKGDAALAIAAGAAGNTTAQGVIDAQTVTNKLAVASSFTADLGTSSTEIVAYSGASAAAAARLLIAGVTGSTVTAGYDVQTTINNIVAGNTNNTYNLTTGVDNIIGGPGNNTINAVLDNAAGISAGGQAATLNSFDTIKGGTLNNTLNITDFGLGSSMSIPAGSTITGITTLNVNSLEGVNQDLSGWSTLTAANFKSTTGTDVIKVGNNTALNVVDSLGNVNTTGGSTVTVKTDTSHTVNVTGGAATSSVSVTGGAGGTIADANFGTSTAGTITSVSVTGSHNTTTVDSDALTSLSFAGSSYASIVVNAAAGTRTLNLTMNGDAFATVTDPTATTVDVSAVTADSTPIAMHFASATSIAFNDAVGIAFISGGQLVAPADKALTISGAGYFTGSTYALNAAAVINATASSGVDTIQLASANGGSLTQSFTGGTGQDIIWIGAGQTGTVTGGSATNNEIVLTNAPAATVAAIANVTHFSTFGVAGSTSGVFDMSKVSGYKAFDVQGSGSDVTFTNAATGSTLTVDGADSHIITLQTADGTGATDSTTLTLGSTTTSGFTVAQVTLEDSAFVGTATVNLISNVSSSTSTNTLTKLGDNNLVTLNLSGTGYLHIGTPITDVSTSVTINNAIAGGSTVSANIAGLSDNYLTSLTLGGTQGITLGTLTTAATSLTITDSNAAHVTISTLTDPGLTSATFTNTVNTTAATFHVGSGAITEAGLATLNLNGNVAISITGDAVTSGITVAGSTDNSAVSFVATGATAAGKTDTIALGNGNDTVTLGASAVPAIPGATEVDTVTWKAITGNAGATETIDVTWQDFATAAVGSETIGGMTVTSDGSTTFTAAQVAAVAEGGTIAGLTITTPASGWTVTAGTGSNDSTFTNTTANTPEATPGDAAFTGSGAAPTFTETIVGVAPAGGTESIGGATVTGTAGAFTAAQVATVAGGGTVGGLTLSTAPSIWTIGAAVGATTTFTSTTANHAEPSPTGAASTGAATAPTEVQTTAGVTPVPGSGGGASATSSHSITLGTGSDVVTDFTLGATTITATGSATATESITADNASTAHITVGNGTDVISATAAGASITVVAGTGSNSVTIGANSSGTISFGAHTGTDTVSLGASGASLTAIEKISGLNNATTDTITFSGDPTALTGFTQVTAGAVVGSGGNTTLLSSWVAAADGAAGSSVTGAAHGITWFQFQGNTYILESVLGATADAGTMVAGNTLVELTGTGYTFAHATGAGGVLHLLG